MWISITIVVHIQAARQGREAIPMALASRKNQLSILAWRQAATSILPSRRADVDRGKVQCLGGTARSPHPTNPLQQGARGPGSAAHGLPSTFGVTGNMEMRNFVQPYGIRRTVSAWPPVTGPGGQRLGVGRPPVESLGGRRIGPLMPPHDLRRHRQVQCDAVALGIACNSGVLYHGATVGLEYSF